MFALVQNTLFFTVSIPEERSPEKEGEIHVISPKCFHRRESRSKQDTVEEAVFRHSQSPLSRRALLLQNTPKKIVVYKQNVFD